MRVADAKNGIVYSAMRYWGRCGYVPTVMSGRGNPLSGRKVNKKNFTYQPVMKKSVFGLVHKCPVAAVLFTAILKSGLGKRTGSW